MAKAEEKIAKCIEESRKTGIMSTEKTVEVLQHNSLALNTGLQV